MAKNDVKQLNQTYDRLIEVLDATDNALRVQDENGNPIEDNVNKIWLTSVEEQEDGTRKSVVQMKNLSDIDEYVSLNAVATEVANKVNDETKGLNAQYEEITNINKEIQDIWTELGTAVAKLTITPVTPTYHAVLFENKEDLVINYKFKSIASGLPTGPGEVVWNVNGIDVKKEQNIRQNADDNPEDYNTFNYVNYAILGSNVIRGTFTDSYQNVRTIVWTINTIKLGLLIDNFNKTAIYSNTVDINFRVTGLDEDSSATVYFELDGQPIYNVPFASSDTTKQYRLAKQTHGAHLLKIYATTKLGIVNVNSNIEYLDIMFQEEGNMTPIISWPYDPSSLVLEQYRNQDFNYSVFTPGQDVSEIQLTAKLTYINLNDGQETVEEKSWELTSDWNKVVNDQFIERTMVWSYRPAPFMAADTSGSVELTIQSGEAVKTKTFVVAKSRVNINPVTSGLVLDLNPQGKSNQDKDAKDFYYEHPEHTTRMTVSPNFDWVNGGWQKDEEGNDIFLIKTGSRMYLDFPLFDNEEGVNDAKTVGKHFKLTYKATNCGTFDAQVMKCREYLGWRHQVQTETYDLDENGEVVVVGVSTASYLNGYNNKNETNDLIWKNGIIDGELVKQKYEKDERDENGIGVLYKIDAAESYVGVNINAQGATLHGSYADLPLVYCEDEIMSLSFDIEPQKDRHNLMTAYINADPSRVVFYENVTSFVQENPQIIEFGSDECDVYIYRFKAYNRNLKAIKTETDTNEIFDDYIADSLTADKMLEEYTANNFLDVNGNIKIDELSNLCPDLRIILITCDRFTKDKKDKVEGCTVQHILKNGRPEDNWIATNVQVKGQGTSSNAYGSSARNIDIKLNKLEDAEGNELDYALTYTDADGQVVQAKKYGMTEESIPVNYFNIKVNVASSENANNACLAEWYNTYDPYVRPVKTNGVRDTMEFHPCIIFLRETNVNDWQEFQPDPQGKEVYHFYACGDFGNSKKNHDVFGMGKQAELDIQAAVKAGQTTFNINGVDYPIETEEDQKAAIEVLQLKECVVEISNNTHPIPRFKKLDGLDDVLPDGYNVETQSWTEHAGFWTGDAIEFRYPEDLFEAAINKENKFDEDEIEDARRRLPVIQPQVQRLWRWIQSTDTTTATNRELNEEEKIDDFTTDSVEYRQAKFVKEYKDYFVEDSLLFQYLFTDRYLMIDNRAKNMFLHTTDGLHWDFTLDYDNDTSLGCENSGYLLLDYNLEDCDDINGIPVYNGNDSVLWENVRTLLQDKLESTYNNDRCKEAWRANNLLGKMNNYQAYKPTLLQMLDMYRKYIRPYKTGHGPSTVSEPQYLERMNGRKTLQRKRFEKYREIYIGSKYRAASFEDGSQDITIRINHNPGRVTVTPYCDMYPYFKWGNSRYPRERKDRARIKRGESFTIVLDNQAIGPVPNQECHFCGATMLSDIGSLAEFKIAEGSFAKAVKLKRLILGDRTGRTISTVSMTNVTLPESPLLEEFDISYTRYNKPLDFSKQPMLKEVYTLGSQVSSITFAPNGILQIAKLNALTKLTMNGLIKLSDFQMSYDLLTSITIGNTPLLTESLNFFQNISGRVSGEIEDINLNIPEEQAKLFDKFITSSDDKYQSKIKLSGYAKFVLGYESDIIKYNAVWPSLETEVETLIPQYEVVFKNYDGSELIKYYVDEGSTSVPNAVMGLGDKLARPSTEQYTFTFANWSPNDFDQDGNYTGGPVYADREYIAEYTPTVRKYSVTFNAVKDNQTATFEVEYGQDCPRPEFDLTSYYDTTRRIAYTFSHWDGISSYITKDTIITAQWDSATGATAEITPAKLLYIKNNEGLVNKFEPGDRLVIKMGANRNFSNVECINAIEEPMYFDGKTCIDVLGLNGEPVSLTDQDKNWTLLVEYKPLGEGSLAGWCDFSGKGVSIGLKGSTIVSSDNRNFSSNVASYTATNGTEDKPRQHRDVIVLTHKVGSGYISVYQSAPWASKPVTGILDSINLPKTSTKLTLGGRKKIIENEDGSRTEEAFDFGTGIIYDCKLWLNSVFSSKDCEELVQWTSEEISFDIVKERSKLVSGKTFSCNLELMTSGTLHFPRVSDVVGSTNGVLNNYETWKNLEIYDWLNNRVYNALPVSLRSMLYQCDVPSMVKGDGGVDAVEAYCWLPAITNLVNISTDTSYYGEDEIFTIMANKYSTYRWTNAWSKTYFSGNTENINMIKPAQPTEGDMYLSATDLTNKNFQNIQIYNDLEWNTQLYYSTSGYGPCYWLRTPNATQPYLGFLHRTGEGVDYDGSNPARAVVFCIAL